MESAGSSSFVKIKQEFSSKSRSAALAKIQTRNIDCSLDDIVRKNQNQLKMQKKFGGGLKDEAKDALRNLNPRFNQRKNFKPNLPSYRIRMKGGTWGNAGRQNGSGGRTSHQVSLMLRGLAPSVRFPDLVELFSVFKEDEPHIKMHYDHQGNIFGTAEILFKFEKTANEAIRQYDKVPLDGYPMSLGFSKPGGRKHSPETAYFWKNKFAGKETPSQQQLDQEIEQYMSLRPQ